tara:strand:+ start:929 stop:1165 length:237 start_codon:yes stop_codon:yes gene_type:complete
MSISIVMSDGRSQAGIERIERAIARIEKAASARAFAADRIQRRHDALRKRVGSAIEALDSLIAAQERDMHDDDAENAD